MPGMSCKRQQLKQEAGWGLVRVVGGAKTDPNLTWVADALGSNGSQRPSWPLRPGPARGSRRRLHIDRLPDVHQRRTWHVVTFGKGKLHAVWRPIWQKRACPYSHV